VHHGERFAGGTKPIEEVVVREPNVAAVMTTQVTTARPETSFKDLVTSMTDKQISAVPVVDRLNRLIGVVSEADALAKQEFHGGRDELPRGDRAGRDRWYRALGQTAAEVMTTPVWTVHPDEPISAAARLLAKTQVRRVFVTDRKGRLMGVVSRRDLLRVYHRSDKEIRDQLEQLILEFGVAQGAISVRVDSGVATLDGELDRRGQVDATVSMVRAVPGVVGVFNNLRYIVDDTVIGGGPSGGVWTGFSP
jgi:CBS domain-containing protein